MGKKKVEPGAEELYQQARALWSTIVDLGLYDEERSILKVTGTLQRAVRQDRNHVRALALLCDLLAEMTAYEEAAVLARRLAELEPDAAEHRIRQESLAAPNGEEKRGAIRTRLAVKWQCTSDW